MVFSFDHENGSRFSRSDALFQAIAKQPELLLLQEHGPEKGHHGKQRLDELPLLAPLAVA
jgi:hypothetical protein